MISYTDLVSRSQLQHWQILFTIFILSGTFVELDFDRGLLYSAAVAEWSHIWVGLSLSSDVKRGNSVSMDKWFSNLLTNYSVTNKPQSLRKCIVAYIHTFYWLQGHCPKTRWKCQEREFFICKSHIHSAPIVCVVYTPDKAGYFQHHLLENKNFIYRSITW